MIETEDLHKNFSGKEVLRGLSLQALPGEITMLVGANGAGKSTTMKLLAGLLRADRGMAFIAGRDIIRARREAQRALSYLPQNPEFHPRLNCLQVLNFYARLRGVDRARSEAMLEQVGLASAARERTGALSGGMRQRLGIALLLLPDAPVLLLDEPGLSLDPGWRARLQTMLNEEAARGKTVLMTTHLIAEWNGVAQRCLLCHRGRIAHELDPSDLPHDFDDFEDEAAPLLGSGRGGGSGDGVLAVANFSSAPSSGRKARLVETTEPARETPAHRRAGCALPGEVV